MVVADAGPRRLAAVSTMGPIRILDSYDLFGLDCAMVIASWIAGTLLTSATSGRRGHNLILNIASIGYYFLWLLAIGHAGDVALVYCALGATTGFN